MPKQIKEFTRGIPSSNDFIVFQTLGGLTKSCLINELPFQVPTNQLGEPPWNVISANYTAASGDKLIITASGITINLPTNPTQKNIEIFTYFTSGSISINLNGARFQSTLYQFGNPTLLFNRYARLVYVNQAIGWVNIGTNNLTLPSPYPSGMSLYIDGGSQLDKSGNNRNATLVTGTNAPASTVGLDGRQVLRFSGSPNQELQVTPFLGSATGATLYIVFTINSNTNYNLIRTANLDDYWRFINDGNGYFGTFLSARRDAYPANMPSSGSHLVSIHSGSGNYELLLNNVSKGSQSITHSNGDRFRICTNDKPFTGDIALILVYPSRIATNSTNHINIVNVIKNSYPSLSI